jgi:ABC-type Fe3+ transport system permease subunit
MPASQTDTLGKIGARSGSMPALKDPTLPVWIGAAVFLVFLMLFPLGSIFRASLWDENGFSLSRYLEVFTNAVFLKAIGNTVVISFWVGVIYVVVGALLSPGPCWLDPTRER